MISSANGHLSAEVSVDCFVYILDLATRTRKGSFIGSGLSAKLLRDPETGFMGNDRSVLGVWSANLTLPD